MHSSRVSITTNQITVSYSHDTSMGRQAWIWAGAARRKRKSQDTQMNCICIDYSKFEIIYSVDHRLTCGDSIFLFNTALNHLRIDIMINWAYEIAHVTGKQIWNRSKPFTIFGPSCNCENPPIKNLATIFTNGHKKRCWAEKTYLQQYNTI